MVSNVGWTSLLWFALVVAAIPFVLRLLKRTPLGGGGGAGPAALKVVGTLALAPSQRIVAIEVGHGAERRCLVVGVTAQGMTTLHTMAAQTPPPLAVPDAAGATPPFAQVLGRLWSKPGDGSHAPR